MSVRELTSKWEDALAQALSPTDCDELPARDLEMAAGLAIRSSLQAGDAQSWILVCRTHEFVGFGCSGMWCLQ